jgi:predicted kinase
MMGYPGSGKTTTSRIIHDLTGAIHLWADQMRCERFGTPTYTRTETKELYQHLNQVTDELLATGQSVIYDTNFNFYRDRQQMRQIAAKHGATVRLIWVRAPKELAHARATQNAHKQGTRILGNMPDEVFEHIAGGLQEPHADESVIVLDGTKITPVYVQEKLSLQR